MEGVTVLADCQSCGRIERSVEDVILLIDRKASTTTLRFECPKCLLFTDVRVRYDKAQELILRGVRSADMHQDEVNSAPYRSGDDPWRGLWDKYLSRPQGPPLTYDDLLDFHLALKDWDGRIR